MQAYYTLHHLRQRRGNLNVGGIGDELSIFVTVRVHLRGKGLFYLAHRAAENDEAAALRYFVDSQALPLQPLLHSRGVFRGHAKLLAVLRGCQPLVIGRRGGIVERRDQVRRLLILVSGRRKHQEHAAETLAASHAAVIDAGFQQWRSGTSNREALFIFDGREDSRLSLRLRASNTCRK